MFKFNSAGVAVAALCGGIGFSAERTAQAQAAIPDFSSAIVGWSGQGVNFISPPSGPHQITNDPAHRFRPNGRNEAREFRVADLSNPILQPWTREELRKVNERSLSGEIVSIPKERCWPVGVPTFLLYPATPVFFIQTPKEVTMIWQQDHQVRRVYLDVPHSRDVKPSWFGESVGHYEGDTLVVDTVGLNP